MTDRQRADAAEQRLEEMASCIQLLQQEIVRYELTETALKSSTQLQCRQLWESRVMQRELRNMAHQALRSQEEERERVSRELHENIGQILLGINVRLAALARDPSASDRLIGQIRLTQEIVQESVERVHRVARELRPSVLDDLGLVPALRSYLAEFAMTNRLPTAFTSFAGLEVLSIDRRIALYRVAQSALTNVVQHSQASRVEIRIEPILSTVRMTVQDNGIAFDVERVWLSRRHKRSGLLGMRERIEMVGGTFRVISTPGQGTLLTAEFPFPPGKPGECPDLTLNQLIFP